jgi:hypothetical protein
MFQRTELIFRGEITAYLNGPRSLTRFRVLETYRGSARAEWWLLMPYGTGASLPKMPPKDGYIVAAKKVDNGFQIYSEGCSTLMMLTAVDENIAMLKKALHQ